MTPKMYDQKEMMMMPLFVLAETKNSLQPYTHLGTPSKSRTLRVKERTQLQVAVLSDEPEAAHHNNKGAYITNNMPNT
jgi:hypothetical protein